MPAETIASIIVNLDKDRCFHFEVLTCSEARQLGSQEVRSFGGYRARRTPGQAPTCAGNHTCAWQALDTNYSYWTEGRTCTFGACATKQESTHAASVHATTISDGRYEHNSCHPFSRQHQTRQTFRMACVNVLATALLRRLTN